MSKPNKETKANSGPIAVNKKAGFNFELLEFIEAGMILTGSEVKSLREKRGNLTDAFAKIRNKEIFLEGFHISPYKNKGYMTHEETRPKKLLLKMKEIIKLERQIKEKGLVIIATKVYFKDNKIAKVQIATAKPKKQFDKREDLQKKDVKLEIARAMKQRRFD